MALNEGYVPGAWNVWCSMCGHAYKSTEMVKNWQGQWRCRRCNEPRQPQDFVKAVPDKPAPPYVQPLVTQFTPAYCSFNDRSAIPGYALPGCSMPGNSTLLPT